MIRAQMTWLNIWDVTADPNQTRKGEGTCGGQRRPEAGIMQSADAQLVTG
jgi:hypothetical protein